jgi:proteasome lid subunit RPN8/RPN11
MANKRSCIYRISVRELRRLRKLAESAQKASQREVGGLVLSDDGFHLKLAFLTNQASRPGQFLIKEPAYEAAKDRAERLGESILGTFHSHPISEAIPGAGDIKNAHKDIKNGLSGPLMLIYDVCGREAKLWEIRKVRGRRQTRELTLDCGKEMVRQSARKLPNRSTRVRTS